MLLCMLLSLRKLKEFKEFCSRKWGQRTIYIFSIISKPTSDFGHFKDADSITTQALDMLPSAFLPQGLIHGQAW